jgi:hypothetical protein
MFKAEMLKIIASLEAQLAQMKALISTLPETVPLAAPVLRTEDTGKVFEMACCLALNTPYKGNYKYSMEAAQKLATRLTKLPQLFPPCAHTAEKGCRYDYTGIERPEFHLSVKTTKRDGKVAPQVIGQPKPKKFCSVIGAPFTDVPALKAYIQANVKTVLPALLSYTLDIKPIDWSAFEYEWTCDAANWKNSSTLKIKGGERSVPIVEFQFHSKSRSNMAIRWCFEEFLTQFRDHLAVEELK